MTTDRRQLATDRTDRRQLRWGDPPLPLLPEALASCLAAAPLTDWVAELLDVPAATATALAGNVWDLLPEDRRVRHQVGRQVLALLAHYGYRLRDVVVATVPGGLVEPPEPARWRDRPRRALMTSAVRPDPGRRYAVTFGDLLSVPTVGVQTALEAAALLELAGFGGTGPAADGTDEDPPRHDPGRPVDGGPAAGGRRRRAGGLSRAAGRTGAPVAPAAPWGQPGTAPLPRSLRLALATTPLPRLLAQDLGLPVGATAEALDESTWTRAGRLSRLSEVALQRLADRGRARPLRIMDGTWPAGVDPLDVPWPARLRNALSRAGYLRPEVLEHLTYGELLDLPAVGVKSAIELGLITDTLCPVGHEPIAPDAVATLRRAAREEWTDRIRADDRRFADVIPPDAGSLRGMLRRACQQPDSPLAHSLAAALPRIRARACEVAAEPVDRALPRLAGALGIARRDLEIATARMGWDGGRPLTQLALARRHGLSRERIRQLAERTFERLERPYLPQLERAVQLLADVAPITGGRATEILLEKGLVDEPVDPSSLVSLARALDYPVPFRIDDCGGMTLLVVAGPETRFETMAVARARAARLGVAAVEEVRLAVEGLGRPWPRADVETLLAASTELELLGHGWYWVPGAASRRSPLRSATRRMLSVTPRLDLPTLRQGLARVLRTGPALGRIPEPVLAAYFDHNPEFVLRGRVVGAACPIDYRTELRPGERAVVEILRAAPGCVLSRAELLAAATARGVSVPAFSSLTQYAPMLDHLGWGRWCLRGARPG